MADRAHGRGKPPPTVCGGPPSAEQPSLGIPGLLRQGWSVHWHADVHRCPVVPLPNTGRPGTGRAAHCQGRPGIRAAAVACHRPELGRMRSSGGRSHPERPSLPGIHGLADTIGAVTTQPLRGNAAARSCRQICREASKSACPGGNTAAHPGKSMRPRRNVSQRPTVWAHGPWGAADHSPTVYP